MRNHKKLIAIITFSLCALLVLILYLNRQHNNRRVEQGIMRTQAIRLLHCVIEPTEIFKDVYSSDGTPLLSWRVNIAKTMGESILKNSHDEDYLRDATIWTSIDLSRSWRNINNLKAAEYPPAYCYYPYGNWYQRRPKQTCLLAIKEMRDKFVNGTLREDEKSKALFVFVEPEYAQPWMKPADVSLADLYYGNIKITSIYVDASFCRHELQKYPETFEEWWDFCGVTPDKDAE